MSSKDLRHKTLYNNKKKRYDKLLINARANHYEKKISKADKFKEINEKNELRKIANKLVSIFDNLLRDLPRKPFDCRIKDNVKTMFLRPVKPSEGCEIAQKLKNMYSSDID